MLRSIEWQAGVRVAKLRHPRDGAGARKKLLVRDGVCNDKRESNATMQVGATVESCSSAFAAWKRVCARVWMREAA